MTAWRGIIDRLENIGGGSLEVTDGSNTVTGVTQITFSGGTVGGTSPDATVTITGSGVTSFTGDGTIFNNSGSTGAVTATLTNTPTGTGAVVLATGPTLSNPIVGTQAVGNSTGRAASTSFVGTAIANAIAGVNPAIAVQAATIQASDTSGFTYSNGVSGVGATLTGTVNTAVTIDGYTFTATGQRLLVKNDTQSANPGAYNGVYTLTQLQTGILAPIFTRATDYNQPSDINNTGAIPVVSGTVNTTTSWLLTSQVTTVGTNPLTYTEFSINPTTVVDTVSVQTIGGTKTFTNPINANIIANISTKTGNYTAVAADDTLLCNAAGGAFTITLPTAVGVSGTDYTVKKIDTSINVVTIATTSSQTIDLNSTFPLTNFGISVTMKSDGANWWVV